MMSTVRRISELLSRTVVLLLAVFCFYGAASAATLEQYKARVDEALAAAARFEISIRDEDGSPDVRALAAQLRRDFPLSERIEWDGGVVETSSDWLLEKARLLEQEPNPQKQLPIIVEVREYLTSISFKLEELNAAIASERTKDQDKQKLAEILQREEYQKPQAKQESLLDRWLREFLEWMEGSFPKGPVTAPTTSAMGVLTLLLQILLYGGLLALLGYLAYKIVPLIFPTLKRKQKPRKKKERIILGERLSDDVTSSDLLGEAERLAREGNLRGAIRKGYIALLCDLSDRKVIGLAHNKTNRDYLRDVRSQRELHPRMKSVTDTFERHWYGLQDSAEQDWARFREDYHDAIRSVSAGDR